MNNLQCHVQDHEMERFPAPESNLLERTLALRVLGS
jgi:hypothetical protein